MPSIQISKEVLADLIAKGLIPDTPKGKKTKAGKRFVEPSVEEMSDGALVVTLPLQTISEANAREWRGRSNRTRIARDMVSRTLGKELRKLVPFAEAYHRGEIVRLTFTRLGGYKLDQMANLGSALKQTEDAVCTMLGANDGASNWKATAEQEPGGLIGVRIRFELG